MAGVSPVKLSSVPLVVISHRSQHWYRWWLGAVRQQAVTWTNVDTDLCHHMVSQGHNELSVHILRPVLGLPFANRWVSTLVPGHQQAQCWLTINSLKPGDTCMHCCSPSSLLQVMAWHRAGAKPFPEAMMTYHQSWQGSKEQTSVKS